MWLLLCGVFALLSSTKVLAATSFAVSPRVPNASCREGETGCGNKCCPYPDGICCSDTQTCCRQGAVCLGSIPYCLGLKQDETNPTLYSERSTALREADCPSDMTTCPAGCCPLPNAMCCPDGITCCPEGTVCDNGMCTTVETAAGRFLKAILKKSLSVPSTNTYDNILLQRRPFNPRAGDDCCESWFGYICCQFPFVCTTMGCMGGHF